jgi:bifunctional non-homologous end joining protein LigD
MALEEYRKKRDFRRTKEPRGRKHAGRKKALRFVVQKHDASRLHYDFRLELDGVLKSWAVPKGPSLDPKAKRLAVHVEDHPIEYGSFEGVIPADEYGGGTVLLWDAGEWIPEGDANDAYRKGRLTFSLEGEKLHGSWSLVRTKGRDGDDDRNWLLIKRTDDAARPGDDDGITKQRPESVATGRELAVIAEEADRVWHSNRDKRAVTRTRTKSKRRATAVSLEGARKGGLPEDFSPQLATLVSEPPTGEDWLHELKLDGYRILCYVDHGDVTCISRNGKDWTDRYTEVVEAAAVLPCETALMDGEVVVLDERGVSSFQALQNSLGTTRSRRQLYFYAFDLMYLDGYDLMHVPLRERKPLLQTLVAGGEGDVIRYSDHVSGSGHQFHAQACAAGAEGIISKRANAPYRPGRGMDWQKTKCLLRQEFVVVGFTEPSGSRSGFGALLIAVMKDGELVSAGRVGTGFTNRTLAELYSKMKKLERATPAIANPPRGANARGVHWLQPKLVAEVSFTEWTSDGSIRHPSFQGLREDKTPEEIVREGPARPQQARNQAKGKSTSQASGEVEVAGVRLTHPDRVVYAEQGITKLDLAKYYERVADAMLPHIADRALTLVRCPTGQGKACFFQKHANDTIPDSIARVSVEEEEGTELYMAVDSLPGLIALVQLGVLEFHVWGSRIDRLDRPDRLIFDLDPDADLPWSETAAAALLMRERMEDLELQSFVKTTGGKGLHVVVPIERRTSWDDVKEFARRVAQSFVREWPARFTATATKSRRKGKIYIDYLRNSPVATSIAAFSTRSRPGAPVSVPITWEELAASSERPDYTIENVPARLAKLRSDPWKDFALVRQTVRKPRKTE